MVLTFGLTLFAYAYKLPTLYETRPAVYQKTYSQSVVTDHNNRNTPYILRKYVFPENVTNTGNTFMIECFIQST